MTDPHATPEEQARLAQSAIDHADWARYRLDELIPFDAQGKTTEARGALESIVAEMKPYATDGAEWFDDPFKLVEVPEWTSGASGDSIPLEEAWDVSGGSRKGWVDPVPSEKQSIRQGFEAFPSGDVLKEYAKRVVPMDGCFDVAMHGNPESVGFGTIAPSMDARELARVILRDPDYHGQSVRLLSCDTGRLPNNGGYCIAEELANALGVTVIAPNDELFIRKNGSYYIGRYEDGSMVKFIPNQRRRIK